MRVDFSVPEQDIRLIAIGMPVTVSTEVGNTQLTGHISAIEPRIDPNSRLVTVRAEVDDPGHRINPGQFLRVRVELPEEQNVVALPQTVVSTTLYGDSVFVVRTEGEGETAKKTVEQVFVDPLQRVGLDGDPHPRGGAQLTQLGGGETRMLRAAAADHPHVGDRGAAQFGQHVFGHVGRIERRRLFDQNAGHVDRHVAHADGRHLTHAVQRLRLGVGVARVPGHERARRSAAHRVFAGHAHAQVFAGAHGVDHCVVAGQQLVAGHVTPQGHQPQKPDVGRLEHSRQCGGHRLDRGVVGCHPVAQQPVRGRQPVEDVDLDVGPGGQKLCREQPGRPRAHDRDAVAGRRHGGTLLGCVRQPMQAADDASELTGRVVQPWPSTDHPRTGVGRACRNPRQARCRHARPASGHPSLSMRALQTQPTTVSSRQELHVHQRQVTVHLAQRVGVERGARGVTALVDYRPGPQTGGHRVAERDVGDAVGHGPWRCHRRGEGED